MTQRCPFCNVILTEPLRLFAGDNPNAICNKCGDLLVTTIEEEVPIKPKCFSYWDGRDKACAHCKASELCKAEFEDTRPTCFAQQYGLQPECKFCIDASQCIEHQKETNDKMAGKTRVRKRVRLPKEEVQTPEVEDSKDQEYSDWGIPDLRAELEDRDLLSQGRKSVLIKRLMADDQKQEGEDEEAPAEEEEAPEKTPVTKVTKVRKVVQKPAPKPSVQKPTVPKSTKVTGASPMSDLAAAIIATLDSGKTVMVTSLENGYTLTLGVAGLPASTTIAAAVAAPEVKEVKKGLRGDAFWSEVLTEGYYNFYYKDAGDGVAWMNMSAEDKVAFAEEIDVKWDRYEDSRVDAIQMVAAIFKSLGIVKYKEEYKSPAVRKALRA